MAGKILNRRFEMYSYILKQQRTTYDKLMSEFRVSKPTVIEDVRFLSEYFGAIDVIPGLHGGIEVYENARVHSMVKLCEKDANCLIQLYSSIKKDRYDDIAVKKSDILSSLESLMKICVLPKDLKRISED